MSREPLFLLSPIAAMESRANVPRVLKSVDEVIAARSHNAAVGRLRHTDCLRIAQYEGHDGYWISTPNMEIIPELPQSDSSKPICYYADGMLGTFEQTNWPQKYQTLAPHAMATPANPNLLFFRFSSWPHEDGQDFTIQDTHNVLPSFSNPKAAWFHITERDFVVTDEIAHAQVGILSTEVLHRLVAAFKDVSGIWGGVAAQLEEESNLRPAAAAAELQDLIKFVLNEAQRAKYCCSILTCGNLTSFHTLLWFRQFQRHLLDMQAVVIYMKVIKPRLDNPSADFSLHTLPLRGIITSSEYLVREAFRCGVPVWWVRPLESLTTDTFIHKICLPVTSLVSFSSKRAMRHGKFQQTAPLWSQAPNDDPTAGNILLRLQKFSLTNHAVVGAVSAYDSSKVEGLEMQVNKGEKEAVEIAGPDVDVATLPHPDVSSETTSLSPASIGVYFHPHCDQTDILTHCIATGHPPMWQDNDEPFVALGTFKRCFACQVC